MLALEVSKLSVNSSLGEKLQCMKCLCVSKSQDGPHKVKDVAKAEPRTLEIRTIKEKVAILFFHVSRERKTGILHGHQGEFQTGV